MVTRLDILIVEDNPGDARLLEEHLRYAPSLHATVRHVERLQQVRAEIERRRPDVMLLDLSLPDAQGMATVHGALDAAPGVPIVVLTGLDHDQTALDALHAGAQDYLAKSKVEPDILSRSILYAIERKRLEGERRRLLASEQEARARAEAAVKSRDVVLRVLSHDLGNQLAAIQVYARMLSTTLPHDEKGDRSRTFASGIQELAQSLQELRENILDAAQIESGRLSMHMSGLDLGELLHVLGSQVQPLAEDKKIELVVVCHPDLPRVRGDRQRLLQALGNLAGNAIKFTPAGGRITFEGTPSHQIVRISVADTGPGIAPENLSRIFESFWKTREGNDGGAGLGLSIAKGIAQMHGGELEVRSDVGKGTVFSMTLPVEVAS